MRRGPCPESPVQEEADEEREPQAEEKARLHAEEAVAPLRRQHKHFLVGLSTKPVVLSHSILDDLSHLVGSPFSCTLLVSLLPLLLHPCHERGPNLADAKKDPCSTPALLPLL